MSLACGIVLDQSAQALNVLDPACEGRDGAPGLGPDLAFSAVHAPFVWPVDWPCANAQSASGWESWTLLPP